MEEQDRGLLCESKIRKSRDDRVVVMDHGGGSAPVMLNKSPRVLGKCLLTAPRGVYSWCSSRSGSMTSAAFCRTLSLERGREHAMRLPCTRAQIWTQYLRILQLDLEPCQLLLVPLHLLLELVGEVLREL